MLDSEVFSRIRDYLADQLEVSLKRLPPTATLSTISAQTALTLLI